MGILLAVGVPSYKTFAEDSQLSTTYNHMYIAYRIARAEAIKTSSPVIIIPGGGGGNRSGFNNGWQVVNETTAVVIYQAPGIPEPWEVSSSILGTNSDPLRFLGNGSFDGETLGVFRVIKGSYIDYSVCILQSGQSYKDKLGGC